MVNATRKGMMIKGVGKNSYTLTMGDLHWIYHNTQRYPKNFIKGLLRRRFNNYESRFGSDSKLAGACLKFIIEAHYEFLRNGIDQTLYTEFVTATYSPKIRIRNFRDIWRGYNDIVLRDTRNSVSKDKEKLTALINQHIERNTILQNKAKVEGRSKREQSFSRNKRQLKNLFEKVNLAFRQDDKTLARKKLYHKVYWRRHPEMHYFMTAEDDYLSIKAYLRSYNPDSLTFPLRFILTLPIGVYERLKGKWLSGSSRADIINALIEDPSIHDEKIIDRIEIFHDVLTKYQFTDRSDILAEYKILYQNKCYHSLSLVVAAQIEGVIWDLAYYLNRRNIRVFKAERKSRKKYPYFWDRIREAYIHLNPSTKRPIASKTDLMLNARFLIDNTRIGSIISPQLFSFLVDEFYDEIRNPMSHGDIKNGGYLPDALALLYCQYSILYEIAGYMKLLD